MSTRPSDEDNLARVAGEPEGHHVREKTEDGYPLTGSSPAERAEQADRTARIKAQAMRDHAYVGDGPYCEARISFRPMGGPDTGTITGWQGCGYPPDMHHERVVVTPTGWIVNSGALRAYDEAYRIWGDRERALAGLMEQAYRENWARFQVARAGKDWRTHLAKFGGAVIPRW